MSSAWSPERSAWLAGLPILASVLFPLFPSDLQGHRILQFLPQGIAYAALLAWAAQNSDIIGRLGLHRAQLGQGLRWGIPTGLLLGTVNAAVILLVVPRLGHDIGFLLGTPHAQIHPALMLPWFIVLIALFIEINFRGFLLGRLLALAEQTAGPGAAATGLAVGVSALAFSFDPFMVITFRHLHWIALWDGLVWGLLWVRLRNLYVPIVAHAVEVMVMYSLIRIVMV